MYCPPAGEALPEKLAASTTPPGVIAGTSALLITDPETCWLPLIPASGLLAFAVTVIDLPVLLIGVHVADHRPVPSPTSASGMSPFENDTTTDPVASAAPQSSATLTTIAAGHATGAEKLEPSA